MKRFLAAFSLLAALLFLLTAPPLAAQSYQITTVEVEGNKSAETSLILSVAGLQQGSKLSSTAVQEAIHRIYGLGLFADVRVDGEYAGGGIRLKITVKEHPKLRSIKIQGNKHLKTDEIKAKLTILENQTAGPSRVQDNVRIIRDLYRQEGYYLTEASSEITPVGEDQAEVVFQIKEKEKVKIRDIRFEGNVAFTDGDLRGAMKSKPGGFLRSGTFKKDEYEEDKDKIVEYCRKKGFIDAAVTGDSIAIDEDGKGMLITLYINEGNRYYFGDITFTGNEHCKTEFLRKQLKFNSGDIYNSEKYEESVANLYTAYQDDGYIHARIIDNVQTIDSTLQIELEISEGVPAHINKVLIEGNNKTKEKVIRRELFSRPGDIFRRAVLLRSMRNVILLNYFNPEKSTPDLKYLPNGDIDLVIKVEEKPTGQVQAGAGYSATDKLVGTIGLGIPNFRGNGQNVNLDWAFGKTSNSISLSFTEPWLLDTPTSLGADIYNVHRQLSYSDEEFTEGNRGGGLRVGRRLNWPDNYFSASARYVLEQTRYYDFDSTYIARHQSDPNSLIYAQNDWQTNSSAGITITRDSRDLAQFATTGSLVSLTSEYSGGLLGGDYEYHKHVFQGSKFTRLWRKLVLVAKMKLGVVDTPGDVGRILYTERFAPGGTSFDGMIRGYEDGSVTPMGTTTLKTTDNRDTTVTYHVRGRSMLVYNLELQMPIVPQQIYTLLFADAGNSWLAGRDVKPFDLDRYDGLKKSVGAGFRVVVPGLGTIGFDLGYGYNRIDKPQWKFHFQLGTTF